MTPIRALAALAVAAAFLPAAPAGAVDLHALTDDNHLVRFDTATPGTFELDQELGDERQALAWMGDNELFVASALSGELHRLDPATGALDGQFGLAANPGGDMTGMASRPGERLIRIVTDAGRWGQTDHYGGAGREGDVSPAGLSLIGNGFAADGTEYAVDAAGDQLMRATAPGTFEVVGPLGVDVADPAGFDADGSTGYLAAAGRLHTVNLATGAATDVGAIAGARAIRDLDVVPPAHVQTGGDPYMPGDGIFEGGDPTTGDPYGIALWRFGDSVPELTVPWSLERASDPFVPAEPGEDFEARSGEVTFASGERHLKLPSPIIDDDLAEGREYFDVRLGGTPFLYFISDYDSEFTTSALSVPENGGAVQVEVARNGAGTAVPSSVDISLEAPAEEPADATLAERRVEFARGETTKVVTVGVVDDASAEGDQVLTLRLASAGAQRLVNPRRALALTIVDDDRPSGDLPPRPPALVPPAVADLLAPTIGRTPRTLRLRRTLRVPITCSEACRATVELRIDRSRARRLRVPLRLARTARRTLRAGRTNVTLRISRRTLARRRARRVPLRLRIAIADAAGNRRTTTRRVTGVR